MSQLDAQDAALGAVLGACVGDASGAVLEFLGREPSPQEVEAALQMPGGGVWDVAPGQITDDGELTLCLARGLLNQQILEITGEDELQVLQEARESSPHPFSLESIARAYAFWIVSRPFDIGNTTRSGLGCFLRPQWWSVCKRQGFAAGMTQAAQASNTESKANGSLMRCTPLGVWGHRLPPERLAVLARQDSRLSHPSAASSDAVACYVLALASLIQQPGDAERAFGQAWTWARGHACQEVQGWMQEAKRGEPVPYRPMDGFVRIGFVWAMRHMLERTPYREAVAQTLLGGGDTDTNACIVGGLVGALHGASSIPEPMRAAVLGCDSRGGPKPRPPLLDASAIPTLVRGLMDRAPDQDPE